MRDDDRIEHAAILLALLVAAGLVYLAWLYRPQAIVTVPEPARPASITYDGLQVTTTTSTTSTTTTVLTTVTPVTTVPAPAATFPAPAPVRKTPVAPAPVFGLNHSCQVLNGRALCQTLNTNTSAYRHGALGGHTAGGFVDLPGRVSRVTAGQDTSCALVSGVPYCWGWRTQVGAQDGATPRALAMTGADEIYAGDGGTICALDLKSGGLDQTGKDDAGSIYCWGEGVSEAGLTGRDWADEPVKLAESADWDDVKISGRTVCTLTGEVVLTCYGDLPGGGHSDKGTVIDTNKAFRHIIITTHAIGDVSVCVTRKDETNVACY